MVRRCVPSLQGSHNDSNKATGIFLENDLIALKSSDDVIDAPATRATVMAKRINPEGVPNWMIMSKPESPFLRRWMEDYQEEKEWNALATYMPLELYRDHDPDLTVLGGHSWFYPLASDPDGDNMLKRLWFGKTWYDIDVSYGTHMWHWKDEIRQAIRPKTVRKIDTPLFCRLRKLFDNLDGDGYMALEWEKDPACKVVTIPDLKRENHRLFADYKMGGDKLDMKLLDSSGTNHHAWAPSGTTLEHGGRTTFRNISEGSYFVMPVPIGWDARVWTVRTELRMDRLSLPQSDNVGLFMIRMDKGDELLIQFRLDKKSAGPVLDVHWKSGRKAKDDEYRKNEEVSWVSGPGLMPITDKAHEITISYDRRDEGKIQLYIDGTPLANQSLPFVHSPKIGQEVWFNARDWDNLDTGFRGELHRFTMYADALQQIDIESTIMATSSSGSTTFGAGMPHASTASSPYFFFPVLLLMLFLTFTVKLFKTLRRDLEESVRMISGTAKTLARGNG